MARGLFCAVKHSYHDIDLSALKGGAIAQESQSLLVKTHRPDPLSSPIAKSKELILKTVFSGRVSDLVLDDRDRTTPSVEWAQA